uniref:Doublecortin domain-containing protein n=1 Tax=Knipowitschia caucasica TaxID=637954 RepID=A0AAV2MC02_KNICA
MNTDKPNFLSQPVVKNVFMYRNGDPYYEARRIVINQKRVCNFDTLLREVSSGIQAPFGAVRNIYTPRGGHKVERLENLQSGQQYVAAGRERFKKLDVVANGDVLNPAVRLLIHQRILGQFDKILELVTDKMGLKVLGGVRSLFTYEGQIVTDGNQLESGQLYVAVGRDKFKKLPYIDLLFSKPRGMTSDSGDSPPALNGNSKEHLSAIVREISQSRLISLRKKRSGQNMALDDVTLRRMIDVACFLFCWET